MAGASLKASKFEGDQDVKVVMDGIGTTALAPASKRKKRVQKVKEEEGKGKVEEERRRDGGEPVSAVTEVVSEWEEWPWMSGAVDEQMSWGSSWLPYWGVEFVGEAYNALYGDVVWDDDIWDLKGINEVPNP